MKPKFWNVRSVKTVELIEVVHVEGKGVEDDPIREVTSFYDRSGELRAIYDPCDDIRSKP